MKNKLFNCIVGIVLAYTASAQDQFVTYAGGSGKEVFYEAAPLSNGNFLVCGYAEDLNWINSAVPRILLSAGAIKNGSGTNKIGFMLYLSSDFKSILNVVHFPKGAVEDIRFIKTSNIPGSATGDVFISGTTNDTRANTGGYFIGKLNNNFLNGVPTAFSWAIPIWGEGYLKEKQPWDVGSDGKVVYLYGQSHGYDWAEAFRLTAAGIKDVVPNWRYHKLNNGSDYKGVASGVLGGVSNVSYSSIILKRTGRCDLRSWNLTDFTNVQSDENGGTKQGKWPLDAFFGGYCDPATGNTVNVTADGKGYTGYTTGSSATYGPSAVAIDRRNNHIYIGMNIQTRLPDGNPDFEPALIAYDNNGTMKWWSRLYHEITPLGVKTNSSPDQYIDKLAVDYSADATSSDIVVLARSHGNNVENFWKGNTIAANPSASGFQNNFTGNNGNIHIQWLGKLDLQTGSLNHSTYLGEYNEGTNNYGSPHPDPNLDGWPNPNQGWPNLNTTRCNDMKVKSDGSVCVVCAGRKTITTTNAYQKGVKPGEGNSPWNNFVRVYKPQLNVPSYSSLITGQFDPATGGGADNTDLYGVLPLPNSVLITGRHKEYTDNPGVAIPNSISTFSVPGWGSASPKGESAILANLSTNNATTVSSLRNPENPLNVVNGVNYAYYEGTWQLLPDFNSLAAITTGSGANFDISPRNRNDNFGFLFSGFINVTTSGYYTFYTNSDDGSKLSIGDKTIVNNDGLHGPQDRSGVIGLNAGKHAISVGFFENGGGQSLSVSYEGPSISKMPIPASVLFRIGSPAARLSDESQNIEITIFPVPTGQTMNIVIESDEDKKVQIEIANALSQTITTVEKELNKGRNLITLNTSSLSGSGIYYVTIIANGEKIRKRFVLN